jgi:hypothetical protein
MPDSPIAIPLNQYSNENMMKSIEKFQTDLSDNFSMFFDSFKSDSKQKAIERKKAESYYNDSKKMMEKIVESFSNKPIASNEESFYKERTKKLSRTRNPEESFYKEKIPQKVSRSKNSDINNNQLKGYFDDLKEAFPDEAYYKKDKRDKEDSSYEVTKKMEKMSKDFLKEYKKVSGKDFAKNFSDLANNMKYMRDIPDITEYLNKADIKKIKDAEKQQEILDVQKSFKDILDKISEQNIERNLEAKQKVRDTTVKTSVQNKIGSGENFNRKFSSQLDLFAEYFSDFRDYFTDTQKRQVEEYMADKESRKKQDELNKLLIKEKKSKYAKIKEKLMDKYNQFVLKHKWFEKSIDAFKSIKNQAGGFIFELLKLGLLFAAFPKEMKDLWNKIRPELKKMWDDVIDGLLKLIESTKTGSTLLKTFGLDAKNREKQKKLEKFRPELERLLFLSEVEKQKKLRQALPFANPNRNLPKTEREREIYQAVEEKRMEDLKDRVEQRIQKMGLSQTSIDETKAELSSLGIKLDEINKTLKETNKEQVKATKDSKTQIINKQNSPSWNDNKGKK